MKTYLTIKSEDGDLLPKAVLEKDDQYGLAEVEAQLKEGDKVVRVKIEEIDEI